MTPNDYVMIGGFAVILGIAFWLTWRVAYHQGKIDAFDQVSKHKIFCFVKQLGANADNSAQHDGTLIQASLNKKGSNIEAWPADLQVRQFPQVPA